MYTRSWRRKLYLVFRVDILGDKTKHFCSRGAAITWLKHYGEDLALYMIFHRSGQLVRVVNSYVYFSKHSKLLHTAESKKTSQFAMRNN